MSGRLRFAFFIILGVSLFIAVAPLLPFHDDWTYLTAPQLHFSQKDLLPGDAFWRPFDAIWGGILGKMPWLFPWINKVFVVVGHIVCVWLTLRVVDLIKSGDGRSSFVSALFFGVSSGVAACLVNTDSLNIVWSCVWGLAGCFLLISGRPLWVWLLCVVISLLCKESGVSFLVVGPLLVFACKPDFKRLFVTCLLGAGVLVVYMILRFVLRGGVTLGGDGYYALTASPVIIMKNFMILVGMSLSSIDGLAWAAGRKMLFFATILLSVFGWGAFAMSIAWRRLPCGIYRILVGVLIIVAFALPQCLFKNHHPAEMHFYPVLIGGAFLVALVTVEKRKTWCYRFASVVMVSLFAIGWCDKLVTIYATSERAKTLLAEVRSKVYDYNEKRVFVVKQDTVVPRYSVYLQPAAWCLDYGRALRAENSWRESSVRIEEVIDLGR